MLGNEAIARGAYEAGVKVTSAYPGTPSTEVSENVVKYKEIYAEWAPNEKVATEVAIGASMAGVRSMTMMKMVGLNVASDPLFTAGYIGVNGGMVLVVADDPGIYSSQNEQDTRAQQQCHGPAEGYRAAVDQPAKNEVAAHSGRQCQRQIGIQAHKQGDDTADQRTHHQQRRLADDNAVYIRDVGIGAKATDS